MPQVEQEPLTLAEHRSSPPVLSRVRVTRSCVCFIDQCLSFWPLCFLSFFDLRILITSLVSSNSSSYCAVNRHRNKKKLHELYYWQYIRIVNVNIIMSSCTVICSVTIVSASAPLIFQRTGRIYDRRKRNKIDLNIYSFESR